MRLRNAYYLIKPFFPWTVRNKIRSFFALRKRRRHCQSWPISHSASVTPPDWRGWPDGKQFCFALTHDVESQLGLDRVRQLAELEMEYGFRSSFNFIPEGDYRVPHELIVWLKENGFEVGVHDLYHDGMLFRTEKHFDVCAKKINEYLKEWGAVGYRSGFMLRNMEWIHKLDILYDASTFDADPFEPQPDGTNTIFPFWVPRNGIDHRGSLITDQNEPEDPQSKISDQRSVISDPDSPSRTGYIELPYTLPQDSTLFLVFRDNSSRIWKTKTDWIASKGGMVLLNLHPDYINMSDKPCTNSEFPNKYYTELLEHIKTKYANQYWHALPKEIAESHSRLKTNTLKNISANRTEKQGAIWIDLENTPHIPFFDPIIEELRKRNYKVVLSARDAYQTCSMADLYGFQYQKIGHHYGKHKLFKFFGLIIRSLELVPFVFRNKPTLSLNHGSRTQNLISKILRIPSVTIGDYEHSLDIAMFKPTWGMVPEAIINSNGDGSSYLSYRGIKEDVYAPRLKVDHSIVDKLNLDENAVIVTVRPPATEAHYHNPEAEELFNVFMDRICETEQAVAVLLPRNKRQEDYIISNFARWFKKSNKVIIPNGVVDGMNLLWHSDLVVSGGGTMNREAAALNVPVYSIFRGTIGAVDRELSRQGRLTLIESVDEIYSKISLQKRPKEEKLDPSARYALEDIINHIVRIQNN